METPSRTRIPLGDVTSSSNTNKIPRHFGSHMNLKRSPPSPFSPSVRSAQSAANLRHKRMLTSAEAEQRPHITAAWAAIYPPLSAAQLEAQHAVRLQEVIDFANLERSFAA